MPTIKTENISHLRGEIYPLGDKSISHRAVMISSIAKGKSSISNLLQGLDCKATAGAFRKMGIPIKIGRDKNVTVEGKGLRGLQAPGSPIDLGNSGTSMRLLLGILAGQSFKAILKGDESLSKRPMKRVTDPLRLMGADIEGPDDADLAPITIKGGSLEGISYASAVASAQVKSAIIFAGLYADGATIVSEPCKSRDHTERMLKFFNAPIRDKGLSVSVEGMGNSELEGRHIDIPGDISSAAFFIALGLLAKDSKISIKSCGVNPTRSGIIRVLQNMGADIEFTNERFGSGSDLFEPIADIFVKTTLLRATTVTKDEIPSLIDEVPILALCATQAEGTTTIEGIGELRVKETDRVNSIVANLKSMGADIKSEADSIIINGPSKLKGASVESFGDHRTAMMLVVAGSIAEAATVVNDTGCIATSFPDFMAKLKSLTK